MIITWGKHKGKEIERLPSGYLKWLAEFSRDEKVCAAADKEWRWREDNDAHFEGEK